MRTETTTWNGEPAIRVRLDYEEAREYLALDEDAIALLDSLTASERAAVTLELYLVPLREVAEYAVGVDGKPTEHLSALSHATTIWTEDDYDEALYSLEGIDRAAYLEILDRAARIIAREVRAWDTEDVFRLVELLTKLDETTDRADRRAEDYVRMDVLPSAPIPEGVDTAYPVWAVDKQGMALVGPGADEVESVEEVRAWCEEHARRMKGIPLRCHKCGHSWMYCGGSQYRTTCPACHITVYLDKCEIPHGDLRGPPLTDEEEVKACTQCGRTLPLSAFRPRAYWKQGRMSWCAECVDARAKERYATDPEYRERIKQERRERYKREGR